jgi:hypothetical protein
VDDLFRRVLELQERYSATNTDPMQERGEIIRKALVDALREDLPNLAAKMGLRSNKVDVEGRDGTGNKSLVPWVRVFGTEQSPSAQTGWYLVYLFSAKGSRVYLSLIQTTTEKWDKVRKAYDPRPSHALESQRDWALPVVLEAAAGRSDLVRKLDLEVTANSKVGKTYGLGNLVALEYDRDALPSPIVLRDDLRFMAALLGRLYAAEAAATAEPDAPVPEVVEAEESAARAARRRMAGGPAMLSSGQGFGLSAVERKLIEDHSVRLATEYFQQQGWTVEDVGAKESYDLLLKRGEEVCHAEVKGTTSAGHQVVLTRAEVEKQRTYAPQNALVVVHSIKLDRSGKQPQPFGGELECRSPWTIENDDLTPISYIYRTTSR